MGTPPAPIVVLVLATLAILTGAMPPPSAAGSIALSPLSPLPSRCDVELDEMYACRPYVSASASSAAASTTPSAACCEAFSTAALDGAGGPANSCLCVLVRNPYALGFPANATRVASLFSSCTGLGHSANSASSFLKICGRGSTAPPPSPPMSDSDLPDLSPAPARDNDYGYAPSPAAPPLLPLINAAPPAQPPDVAPMAKSPPASQPASPGNDRPPPLLPVIVVAPGEARPVPPREEIAPPTESPPVPQPTSPAMHTPPPPPVDYSRSPPVWDGWGSSSASVPYRRTGVQIIAGTLLFFLDCILV